MTNQPHCNPALQVIQRVNHTILQIRTDRKKLLKEIGEIIVEERGYEMLWIGEFRHGDLYPSISCGNPGGQPQQLQTWITQAPFNPTAAKKAVEQKQAVVSQYESKGNVGARWFNAAVPIFVHDEVSAILNACTFTPQAFDPQEILLLEELAVDIGFALESMDLETRRREAEDALRISEGRFKRLAENALVGIVLIQGELVRYANPALAQMFGYETPEAMIDQLDLARLIAPEHRQGLVEAVQQIQRGNQRAVRDIFKGLRRDGSSFDVEAHAARTIHARRPAVIATVMDVTEREHSRQQLEALSEAGLAMSQVRTPEEALQKAVQLALRIVPGDAANIYLLKESWLQRAAEAGYPHDAQNPRPRPRLSLDTTFHHMLETRAPLLINDTAHSALWTPNPNKNIVSAYLAMPLIVRGEVIGFLNIDSWETDRFAEEDAQHLQRFADYVAATIEHLRLIASLEEERQRLSMLNRLSQSLSETLLLEEVAARALEHLGVILHASQGIISQWDPEKAQLSVISGQGITPEAIVKLNAGLHDGDDTGLANWVARQRESALLPDVHQDPRWISVPGVDEWVASALNVPLEVHGELIGVLSLLSGEPAAFSEEDRRLVEFLSVPVALALQNARFYQAAAHQAQLMAEALQRQEELDRIKDELIQNISHELRTPLGLVMGYAVMLQDGTLGPIAPEQEEAIDIITRRSKMLRTLVENITLLWQLDREKDERTDFEFLDLTALVDTVVQEFQNQAKAQGITVRGVTPGIPVIIHGIPLQIHRVLDNLIGNAFKFTPQGEKIEVSLEIRGEQAALMVSDTGIGVPPEKLEKIFERFYQVDGSAKRRYGGTGLGLALVRAIVEAHGGRVFGESPISADPEHPGLRVTALLPVSNAERGAS
ncbi:MAG TPA: GAF domain-containing protein [Anaerolineae bacterium]|nr:GAF domain-containing protein [Anaerolineae bacterium]